MMDRQLVDGGLLFEHFSKESNDPDAHALAIVLQHRAAEWQRLICDITWPDAVLKFTEKG